jgi:hypothetical protein
MDVILADGTGIVKATAADGCNFFFGANRGKYDIP